MDSVLPKNDSQNTKITFSARSATQSLPGMCSRQTEGSLGSATGKNTRAANSAKESGFPMT